MKAASSFLAEAFGKPSQALQVDGGEPEIIIFESAFLDGPVAVERSRQGGMSQAERLALPAGD